LANDGFGFAATVALGPARVHVGGIEQVETGIDEGVEQRKAGGLIGRPAEHIATKGQWRDLKVRCAQGPLGEGRHRHDS
jgi:hypothetical protein